MSVNQSYIFPPVAFTVVANQCLPNKSECADKGPKKTEIDPCLLSFCCCLTMSIYIGNKSSSTRIRRTVFTRRRPEPFKNLLENHVGPQPNSFI